MAKSPEKKPARRAAKTPSGEGTRARRSPKAAPAAQLDAGMAPVEETLDLDSVVRAAVASALKGSLPDTVDAIGPDGDSTVPVSYEVLDSVETASGDTDVHAAEGGLPTGTEPAHEPAPVLVPPQSGGADEIHAAVDDGSDAGWASDEGGGWSEEDGGHGSDHWPSEPPATDDHVDPEIAAAEAFWDTPDEPVQARAPMPVPLDHDPALSPDEPRRNRRRRRRRGGGAGAQARTELPIDSPEMAEIVQKLRRQFGLREFRPGQERVIRDVLAHRDTLAVMPTGSGKSLTYQLPAQVIEGVTVVVSPLLALMKDQTDKLRKRGVVAARLDSSITVREERETLQMIEEGNRKLIYVTPERAGSMDFKGELGEQPVGLFVIDEAHCVSQWGHDFRPAYLNLKRAIEELGNPPVLALTATATPRVVEDIKERLSMDDPDVVHLGFARPELTFEVRAVADEKQQVRRLLRLVRRIRGSGIVYCSTVSAVDALSGALNRIGMRVGKYHGKMTKQERDFEQQRFMKNQVRVIIATNAFGLGVDKPDIRFVIHYNLPGSVEQYYQEAGRSGRDGKPARCILLWRPGDEEVQKHFNTQKYPGRDQVRAVAESIVAGPGKLEDIALRAGVPQKKAQVVLAMLEEAGLAKEEMGSIWTPTGHADEATVWHAAEAYRKKREGDRERLQAMLDYAETRKCRVQFLLGYFGEETVQCEKCDNCTGRHGQGASDSDEDGEEEPQRPAIEIPEAPPPPRKSPTTMF